MNDKAIREILIAYLQATHKEIRIYQEKSIGSSICDVMAVTTQLVGYEIKSDLDNYHRLQQQVAAYDRFFDANYLVVSSSHSKSAQEKVPAHWGILCIQENNITLVRPAGKNKQVDRKNQLSILWKLELKNLLMKNNMPLFAQKEKGYIAQQIVQSVPEPLLGEQIAQELMRRDYSVYNAEDYTLYYKENNDSSSGELVDMLSELNLREMTLDKWIALYQKASQVQEKKEAVFQAPVERVPHVIPYTDIEVSLGVPWIHKEIIADFIGHIAGEKKSFDSFVHYEPVTGNWHIRLKNDYRNTHVTVTYGLERYNALYIIEATLNLREIKLFDNGNQYNERDTLAALEKQRLIQKEFKRWIWLDEDRRWQVEEEYNRMFANYQAEPCDGSGLQFPAMSSQYHLFDYQKNAVQKILTTPNTLLAFDVGAGKTFIMIAAAMKLRQEGISRKNLFVVPNHIVGQWEKIFTDLYPDAKVLAIEPKSYKPQLRQKVLSQIRDGDYDGIIMAYSCFEMIPISQTAVFNNMNRQLERLNDALKNLRISNGNRPALEREKKYIRTLTQDFLASMNQPQSEDITFDDLEVNTLFVDEAHNYKNIPIRTKLKNLNGINTKGSAKCLDLLHKVRQVQATNDGRGVVFATGTPLCNSIADAYVMQLYLQFEELEQRHLDVFDNWVKTFALPEQLCEIDVDTSKFRMVRRFSKFFNLPELSRMFSQVAVFYAVNAAQDLPEFQGYTDVVIEKYPELTQYMEDLCVRTDAIRKKMVNRKEDNMLKVSIDGRKAALHLSLVGKEQPQGESSKVYRCVENVMELSQKHPHSTQLIFCDYSTPKGDDFSVYNEIREQLIAKGIPQKEIAFIHHYQTESRKLELFRKFNAGEMRVLIGSTFKLGIGANVQGKLKAIHHLDVPWRPADMVQREGRILRRGNENQEVHIYRYITQGSFDSYSWQILETKQRFITQFLAGSTYQRSVVDLENNVLTYAQVKALALSQPLMKQLAEKENEMKTLRILCGKEKETQSELEQELNEIDEKITKARWRWLTSERAVGHLAKYDRNTFIKTYQNIKELFTQEVIFSSSPSSLPKILGFGLEVPAIQDEKKPYIFLCFVGEKYLVPMGDTPAGNARRIVNALQSFGKFAEKDKERFDRVVDRKNDLEKTLKNHRNPYREQLDLCQKEVAELRELIALQQKK